MEASQRLWKTLVGLQIGLYQTPTQKRIRSTTDSGKVFFFFWRPRYRVHKLYSTEDPGTQQQIKEREGRLLSAVQSRRTSPTAIHSTSRLAPHQAYATNRHAFSGQWPARRRCNSTCNSVPFLSYRHFAGARQPTCPSPSLEFQAFCLS